MPAVVMQFLAQAGRYEQGREVEGLGLRRVRLSYDPADPYAVTLEASNGDTWARWVFARTLLAHGPARGAGVGDVHVCPVPEEPGRRVAIILRTEPGVGFELVLRRAEINAAVDRFEAVVPIGSESEHIDWDTELAALGGGEA